MRSTKIAKTNDRTVYTPQNMSMADLDMLDVHGNAPEDTSYADRHGEQGLLSLEALVMQNRGMHIETPVDGDPEEAEWLLLLQQLSAGR